MGFFDDIIIPPENFKKDTRFEVKEQIWVWQFEGAEAGAFLDLQQVCCTRVGYS
jgi:hypothetical protein